MVSLENAEYPIRRLRRILGALAPLAFLGAATVLVFGASSENLDSLLSATGLTTLGACLLWARHRAQQLLREYLTKQEKLESRRKQFERHLQETQKLESLGILAGGIAHDFNNLLAGILGYAEMAALQLEADSPAQRHLQQIEKAALRAAELTAQMLHYAGRGLFIAKKMDLQAVAHEICDKLRPSLPPSLNLVVQTADGPLEVRADLTQMRQILTSLVWNAVEAIGSEPGTIEIRTSRSQMDEASLARTYLEPELPAGPYVVLQVSDTGCGMNAELMQRIFDPFFTTKFPGRGLGLSAVLGIVRRHRGALEVQSNPGQGSVFRILLPGDTEEPVQVHLGAQPVSKESDRVFGGATTMKATILVIDDESHVRTAATSGLERAGYAVLSATNGAEGIALFQRHQSEVRCVLVDFVMPELNGEDVCRALLRLDPNVVLLLMSGYESEEVMTRFVGMPIVGFLHKPFRMLELQSAIRKALNQPVSSLSGPY